MIVRRHQIISPATGKVVPEHPGIRVGADYPVLEIITSANRVLLRIPGRFDTSADPDGPGLWDAAMRRARASPRPASARPGACPSRQADASHG